MTDSKLIEKEIIKSKKFYDENNTVELFKTLNKIESMFKNIKISKIDIKIMNEKIQQQKEELNWLKQQNINLKGEIKCLKKK